MILNFDYVYKKYNLDITGILHIGGHYGNVISDYQQYDVNNIVLFEPLSSNFSVLSENAKNSSGNITIHQVALGNETKRVTMNVSDNEGQSSSVLNPKVHLTAHPEVSFIGTEEVEMRKLDDYNYHDYNMMVIDVQGYELEVFKGAIKTLENINYIFCEVNRDEVYEGNATIEEIDQFLFEQGFERVEVEWYYSLVFGDAFYIRKNKKISGNVSIICSCKNRYDALKLSLNSWLKFDEIKEIIIVDWSSDEPIYHITELDPRIKVITVPNKKYYNKPQPLNLAASLATGEYILKMDCDYILNPYYNFFEKYQLKENCYISGRVKTIAESNHFYDEESGTYCIKRETMSMKELNDYFTGYSPFYQYLTGLLYIKKENFNKVGGYNEIFDSCYAMEDGELCERLNLIGLTEIPIEYDTYIMHIPHSNKARIENHAGIPNFEDYINSIKYNLSQYYSGDELEWQLDYGIVQKHIEHNKNMIGDITEPYVKSNIKWDIAKISNQKYIAIESMDNGKLRSIPSVYYVSLEECSDRRDELEQQFKNYNIIPNAIISKRYSESKDLVTGKYVHTLNDGTKGCCVSHLKAIKKWYEDTDEDYGFFCEDDLSLETVESWDFTWEEFMNSIPRDAECVQLFTIRSEFDTFDLRPRYWDDWGATAYIITRSYAKKLIDTFIIGETFNLEIPNSNLMPLIETILFSSVGTSYVCPLFVENVKFDSTFVGEDDDVNDGQKTNHRIARQLVLDYWKNKNNKVEKTELEHLLSNYSIDTENPDHNFNLGLWYENEGHTAPALSYYLRCAERASESNPDLAYEALIRGSYCYKKQSERDGSTRSLLWQAQMFKPDRPEAHYLLSEYAKEREWWQDCYVNADLALRYCNFDQTPLITDVGYPGKYGLLLQKVVSGWWWGKNTECRQLLQEIKNEHTIKDRDYNFIQKFILDLSTGYIPEHELKYNKNSNRDLKFKFEGWEKVENNYSQAGQDLFVLSALNGKRNGLYLEIGAQEPYFQNNTALLETKFDWEGISIEIREDLCKMFSEQRKNQIICADATKIDYTNLLDSYDKGQIFDYLQLDCEPSDVTFEILKLIPFDKYKFKLITYEHDHFVDLSNSYRTKSREYLESKGYKILVSNVSPNDWSSFEDWWYHPDLLDAEVVERMSNISDITDIRSYLFVN